ncbi:MAG TPA: hypothetical protein ENI39_00180, partial [Anaerolineae bacterium]|nr:hypothetical protein [Anaerolineae bacterium]
MILALERSKGGTVDPRQETSAATPPPGLTINTLGRLEIRWGGEVVPLKLRKTQALLVYLALNPGPHDRSRLAGLLWGDRPEEHARRNLRHALSQLRRLAPTILESDRLTVRLSEQIVCRVDARIFEAEIERAERRRRAGDPEGAVRALRTALDLYQGEFLADFDLPGCPEFEEWVTRRRAWLHQQALDALVHLASYYERRGEYERALHYARRLLALDPWREEAHRQLMRLLALTGQRSTALAQYEKCRRLLAEELGLEPLEETTALYEQIRDGEKSPHLPIPSSPHLPISPSPHLPFVGRGDEHAQLVAWWERAQRGEGRLALVEGEAGVGKTRLVEEVARYAEAQGAVVLRGRCYEFGNGVPYQPVAEALRVYLRETPSPPLPLSLSPVWLAELSRLVPEVRESRPDLPEPVSVSGEAARQRLFEAVARLLSVNPANPLFFFLDDLHWADRSTLDLLHYLVRQLKNAPVWLVGTYRPEEVNLSHPLTRLRQGLSRDHLVNHLVLKPLSAEAVGEIALSLVGEEEGVAFGAFLYRESEGNPFILGETVSSLQERGVLCGGEGGRWQWAGPPPPTLPVGVRDVVLQRVGRLSQPAQRLLTLAAVIGRQFDLSLLEAAAGPDADAVENNLHEWLDRHLVRLIPHSPFADSQIRHSLDFSHDKIRAVVYHAAGAVRRRMLHRRVGEALERLYAEHLEMVYEQLAHHYEQAGVTERTLVYLPLAAAKAEAVYANQEALNYYDRALALLGEDEGQRWE